MLEMKMAMGLLIAWDRSSMTMRAGGIQLYFLLGSTIYILIFTQSCSCKLVCGLAVRSLAFGATGVIAPFCYNPAGYRTRPLIQCHQAIEPANEEETSMSKLLVTAILNIYLY
jgi:hypothetical protein